jgi:hypothetical protein
MKPETAAKAIMQSICPGTRSRHERLAPGVLARDTTGGFRGRDAPPTGRRDLSAMTVRTQHLYIVRDDEILGGGPIIVGSRVPVRPIGGTRVSSSPGVVSRAN